MLILLSESNACQSVYVHRDSGYQTHMIAHDIIARSCFSFLHSINSILLQSIVTKYWS